MIRPRHPAPPTEVARHYDELGSVYRQLWGDHLHHGLWDDSAPSASIEEATIDLLEVVIAPLDLRPEHLVIDIGCGYGAPARWVASATGADLIGLTLSAHQVAIARAAPPPSRGSVTIETGDWLVNSYPDHFFDAALAIESLAHMPDKPLFFRQLARTLKPDGRAALACWIVADDLSPLETPLLQSLCRDGRLSGIGTRSEYCDLLRSAGLHLRRLLDLTSQVEPTWSFIAHRAIRTLLTRPSFLFASLRQILRRPRLAFILPKMIFAYRLGALRYVVLCLDRDSRAERSEPCTPTVHYRT